MAEPRIVKVSPHLLMDVFSCETKAWTRHVKGFTSKGDAIRAVAGQAFHKAAEVYLNPNTFYYLNSPTEGATIRENAVRAMHTIYDPAFQRLAADKLDPSLTPVNLDRVLRRWIEMHPPAMLPWARVLAVEEAFVSRRWRLDNNLYIELIVRPDAVVEDHAGKVRWVDTKTTGWHITDDSWKLALRLALQTQLYSDAVVQRYGERAIYGGWINAIELRKLPGDVNTAPKLKKDGTPAKPRLCQEHKLPYAECGNEHAKTEFIECLTTPEKVATAVRDAEHAARRYALHTLAEKPEAMLTQGTSNSTCRFCPAAQWCDSGRPAVDGALESFMIYEPYPVEPGKRAE